jgi:hypothetical protein
MCNSEFVGVDLTSVLGRKSGAGLLILDFQSSSPLVRKIEEKLSILIIKIIISMHVRIGRVVISLVIHPANLLFYKDKKVILYKK